MLLANVWDVSSAKVAEKLKFDAIGTSSSAIATMLGYEDGEEMTFSELEYIVKRIRLNTSLPLSVDLEAGYSREPEVICHYIQRLALLGIAGINIEDSVVDKKRTLVKVDDFALTIEKLKTYIQRECLNIFLNVRTDTFLLNVPNTIYETKSRIERYQDAGADGIFTPCIVKEQDIETIIQYSKLPINVMCMPNLPHFDSLAKLGVKRISMGNFLFDRMYHNLQSLTAEVLNQKSFKSIF